MIIFESQPQTRRFIFSKSFDSIQFRDSIVLNLILYFKMSTFDNYAKGIRRIIFESSDLDEDDSKTFYYI